MDGYKKYQAKQKFLILKSSHKLSGNSSPAYRAGDFIAGPLFLMGSMPDSIILVCLDSLKLKSLKSMKCLTV